jgi:hypothetical protein
MFKKENAKSFFVTKQSSGSSYKTYVFECIECNADINLQSGSFKTHSGKCKKCAQKGRPFEHILNELKHTCKTKTRKFIDLSYDEFMDLIKDKKCHYCNKKLEFSPHTRDKNSNYTSRAYQLDRKDNTKGYVKDNLVTCCWDCNRIKSDIYTYEEFIIIAEALKIVYEKRIEVMANK